MTSAIPGSRKGLLSREDYLAPPAVPTGKTPKDALNTIGRKNDVCLDIGAYNIGSAVMVIWPVLLMSIWFVHHESTSEGYFGGALALSLFIVGIPILLVFKGCDRRSLLSQRWLRDWACPKQRRNKSDRFIFYAITKINPPPFSVVLVSDLIEPL